MFRNFSLLLLAGSLVVPISGFGLETLQPYREGSKIVFSAKLSPEDKTPVFLVGSFNGWKTGLLQLTPTGKSTIVAVSVALSFGRYEYQYDTGARWVQDRSNPLSIGDGFGGVNSVIYINDAGNIEWNHTDKYDFRKPPSMIPDDKSYPVTLTGSYSVNQMSLLFTNLLIHLSNGVARTVQTEAGVTGLLFWGDVTTAVFDNPPVRYEAAKGIYLRFNPEYFNIIKSNLIKIPDDRPALMDCNNLFFLRSGRFFSRQDEFIIPPSGFVGITICDAEYKNERVFVLDRYAYHGDFMTRMQSEPIVKIYEAKRVEAGARYREIAVPIIEAWIKSLKLSDESYVKPYLRLDAKETGFVFADLFFNRAFIGIDPGRGETLIETPVDLPLTVYSQIGIRESFFVETKFIAPNKREGRLHLLIGKTGNEWKIVNFVMSM